MLKIKEALMRIRKMLMIMLMFTVVFGITACKSESVETEISESSSSIENADNNSEEDDVKTYVLSYTDNTSKSYNTYYEKDIPDVRINIDGNAGYMLDFDCKQAENGSKIEKKRNLSSFSAAVIYNANNYTNDDLGLENDNEKHMAVQYALWCAGKSASINDSQMTESIFDLRNVVSKDNPELIENVKKAAEKIIEDAANNPYYVNPQLNINQDSAKIVRYLDEKMFIVGPYNISAIGYDVENVSANPSCDYADCIIVDNEGKKLEKFENNQDIYVRVAPNSKLDSCDDTGKIDLNVNFNVKGNIKIASVLGNGEEGVTEYATLLKENVDLTEVLHINCPDVAWNVVADSEKPGSIRISEIDQDEKTISGATFEVKDSNGEIVATMVDQNGLIELDNLKAGEYFITEIEGPSGYIWEDKPQSLTVVQNNTSSITFTNIKDNSGIRITVLDEEGAPLKNVEFAILDAYKNQIGDTVVSDSDGIAYKDGLTMGKYFIKEVSVPSNIVPDEDEHEVEIDGINQTVICTAIGYYVRGKLYLVVQSPGGLCLPDTTVYVYDTDGNIVSTLVTDDNGEASTGYLKNGKYFLQQLNETENGYVLDTDKIEIDMEYNDMLFCHIDYSSRAKIRIMVKDKSGNPISGIKYEVRRDDNEQLVDTITTDNDGIAITKELLLGTYYYKEIEVPENMEMNPEEYIIRLNRNNQIVGNKIEK